MYQESKIAMSNSRINEHTKAIPKVESLNLKSSSKITKQKELTLSNINERRDMTRQRTYRNI